MDGRCIQVPLSCSDVTSCDDIKPVSHDCEDNLNILFQFLFFRLYILSHQTDSSVATYLTNIWFDRLNTFLSMQSGENLDRYEVIKKTVILMSKTFKVLHFKPTFKYILGGKIKPNSEINPILKVTYGSAVSPLLEKKEHAFKYCFS